ncbi:MAG: hypothetical protein RLZZ417_436 [Bacteroidota bacterium]|jgi:hypothetical protein
MSTKLKSFLYFLFLSTLLTVNLNAQNMGKLSGVVLDSAGGTLSSATVMLLKKADSTLVEFALSENDGRFKFEKLAMGDFLLNVTYLGYKSFYKPVTFSSATPNVDMGNVVLESQSTLLNEITVEGERNPMTIKKDTVEYNSAAFQVQPNANVEELLKKLPGVQVDRSGNVQAQGETVNRILVDGKEFFGRDPKMATKNLPASAIDKIQVFDKKSDQAEFTGVDDGQREKTINLTLKEDSRKGSFGNLNGGIGSEERFQGKASLNKFGSKEKISFIGMANNINNQGFSFEEYVGFTGGMSRGGGIQIDGDSPINNGNNTGFTNTYSGGLNYTNTLSKNTELNGSYFYSLLDKQTDRTLFRENFLADRTFFNTEDSKQNNRNLSHRLNVVLDHKLDSFQSLKLTSRVTLRESNTLYDGETSTLNADYSPSNSNIRTNTSEGAATQLTNDLLYRRRLSKPGRSYSANFSFNLNNDGNFGENLSENTFFKAGKSRTDTIKQRFDQDNERITYGVRLSYTEPLFKLQYLEMNYDYRHNDNNQFREVYDLAFGLNPFEKFNSQLSNKYTTDYNYHRGGANYRYSGEKFNITAGASLQYSLLTGDLILTEQHIEKKYTNILPAVRMRWEVGKGKNLSADYSTNVREPSLTQLQPLVDNSNPLNIYVGNPDLRPEYSHNVGARFFSFNQFSMTNIFIFSNIGYTQNKIRNTQVIDDRYITTTRPENVANDLNFSTRANFGTRIKPLKIRINSNAGIIRNKGLTYINGALSTTNSTNLSGGLSIENQKKELFDWQIGIDWTNSKTSYSIATQNAREYSVRTYTANINIPLFKKAINLSSNLDYEIYSGLSAGFNQAIPIWNSGLSVFILKDKKGELKLAAIDMLNRNTGISRSADFNYTSDEQIRSLGRYFMLSFTYSIKGKGMVNNPMGMPSGTRIFMR